MEGSSSKFDEMHSEEKDVPYFQWREISIDKLKSLLLGTLYLWIKTMVHFSYTYFLPILLFFLKKKLKKKPYFLLILDPFHF